MRGFIAAMFLFFLTNGRGTIPIISHLTKYVRIEPELSFVQAPRLGFFGLRGRRFFAFG